MATTRTPRRRVPDTSTVDPVIFLPAPQSSDTLPLPRQDTATSRSVAPSAPADRRSLERQAVYNARQRFAQLTGQAAPPQPSPTKPTLDFDALLRPLRQSRRVNRRLMAHAAVLLLACLMAAGGGFPLYPNVLAGSDATTETITVAHDPSRMVIPHVATVPNAIGGINRETPSYNDEAPPLIAPSREQGPTYIATHEVQPNETVASIAERYDISAETLIAANNLSGFLAIGDRLRVPRRSGIPHVVTEGDTLTSIAQDYGVTPEIIMAYTPNNLDHGQAPVVGTEIFIPNASLAGIGQMSARGIEELAQQEASAAAMIRDDQTNLREGPGTNYKKVSKLDSGTKLEILARHEDWAKVETPTGIAWVSRDVVYVSDEIWPTIAETNDFPPPPPPPPVWVWPTWGNVTSGFGYRNFSVGSFHNGIDIANRQGTSIVAARTGTVSQAGWCSGYGYCVKISHGDGMITEYGHMMSHPVVTKGQSVEAGELIGYMGSTYDRAGGGYSTGPHLHFTVKVDGVAINPRKYLP